QSSTVFLYQEIARPLYSGSNQTPGGGIIGYGDDWYRQFGPTFACFDGDYDDAVLEETVLATIQVGIDLYGKLVDGGRIIPAHAHHAGRKGMVMMAGLLLNDQNILDQCYSAQYPENFGVDDAHCGYARQDMVGVQPRRHKGFWQYKYEQEHVGLAHWSHVFSGADRYDLATNEQTNGPDLHRMPYFTLSFENEMMYQTLWGMMRDPTAEYYNPAYFDMADRVLAIRFGDQIDGVWNASRTGQDHFIGNFQSISPNNTRVQHHKIMRDNISRPNYVHDMIPEPLIKPQVTHDGSSGHIDVDFNVNDFRCPQDKDAAITGYDLRWTAYAGGSETVTSEADPEYIGNFDWTVIEDISIPYQLTGVPRGVRIKVQIRMKNGNGSGPWMDDRKREHYAEGNATSFAMFSGSPRFSTDIAVPDNALFNTPPLNYFLPTVDRAAVLVGGAVTMDDGTWIENPATTLTERVWQQSDTQDGSMGWTIIAGETGISITPGVALEGKFLRPGVRKTNSEGVSDWHYGNDDNVTAVVQPVAVDRNAAQSGSSPHNPGSGPLGGKILLIFFATRAPNPIAVGGSIGAYSFGAPEVLYEDNTGTNTPNRERQIVYQVVVPAGEAAETITFTYADSRNTVAVYEPSSLMQVIATDSDRSGLTTSVETVLGGAALWMSRSDGAVAFADSPTLVRHKDNPAAAALSDAWAFAHDFSVGDSSVSATHTTNRAGNGTRVTLISLGPVP
ncbi:MAG: hypothetical protein AB8B85_03440, partial [Paracoccaceae bacterium]